ncbi:MAG: spore Coat Protein domain protein [Massilia sp.]|nr:spore Coat Protein domain protein [Massilia sp.]
MKRDRTTNARRTRHGHGGNRLVTAIYWALMALVLFCGAGSARADNCNATMSDINFGAVSPLSASGITVSATGTVTCAWTLLSAAPPYLVLFPNVTVCVNIGLGAGSVSANPRTLTNGGAKVEYNLYRDASLTPAAIAGATTLPSASVPILSVLNVPNLLLGGSISQSFTVWGNIPAGSALAAVPTVGNADTNYVSSFAGHATISYAFYNLVKPACTSGQSGSFAFTVRARVVNDCRINSAPLSFGTVGTLTGALRSTSALSVQCVNNNAYQVVLNGGTGANNVGARKMKSAAGGLVGYRLSSTLDGPLWGDGTLGTAVLSGVGTGATVNIPMYGMVPAQATPAPGDYRDTVTATVVF